MSLRHALLGLLAERPASGYDLMKRFDTSLANVWPATQSQLYTELGKLTREGLIAVAAKGPRGRKEYDITAEGRAELRRWLVETRPHREVRSEALLRVFFLGQIPGDEARAYLEYLAGTAGGQYDALVELEGAIPWDDDDLSLYGRMALEYGKRFSEMRRDWADWASRQLR